MFPVTVDRQPQRVWDWADNPVLRTARAGIEKQPYRSWQKLTRPETWLLPTGLWRALQPGELAAARWWSVPVEAVTAASSAPDRLRLRQRHASDACVVDAANALPWSGDGVPARTLLSIYGWSFDKISGTAVDEVAIELTSAGRTALYLPAERYERTDVARAFNKPALVSAGIAVRVLLTDAPAGAFKIRLLQMSRGAVSECETEKTITIP
jgi:hypothetical protein